MTLDCAGHEVRGNGGVGIGIHVAGRSGVTVKRCVVTFFADAIVLEDSSHSTLAENVATLNMTAGIRLTDAHLNRVTGNRLFDTTGRSRDAKGIVLAASTKNRVEFNLLDHGDMGLVVAADSASNEIAANVVVSSFGGAGIDVAGASNTLQRNTALYNRGGGFLVRASARRNKLVEKSACFNLPNDGVELGSGNRGAPTSGPRTCSARRPTDDASLASC